MFLDLRAKYSYSCQILMKCVFSEQILKGIQILNFMKVRRVEAKLCFGDGLRDRCEVANSRLSLTRIRMERAAGKRKKSIIKRAEIAGRLL